VTDADVRKYLAMVAPGAAVPATGPAVAPSRPGAALDHFPWAASWQSYLKAISTDNSARAAIANAMSERIPAAGGFLVPERLRSEVLSYMTSAVIRPHAMFVEMDTLRFSLPVLDNPTQASGTGVLGGMTFEWTEEGAGITPSVASFGAATLEARKLAGLLKGVPNELLDDSPAFTESFLPKLIGAGVAWTEDDYFFNGTGTGEPQGLINAPCAVAVSRATGSTVGQTDLAGMLNALHPAALQAGYTADVACVRWLVSASAFSKLLNLYLSIGTPANQAVGTSTWLDLGDGDKVAPSLLGLPMSVTDHQPQVGSVGDVILADLSQFAIGEAGEMTVEVSSKGDGFVSGTSNVRVRHRVDGRYWIQGATTTEANQQVSPVVVLH
jgi:HK97 family phage major capsid protein